MGGHIFTLSSKLHQFNRAREINRDNFTSYSVQDRIMTPSARRVLAGRGGGDIGANKGHLHFLNGEAMIKSARTELKVNGTRFLTSFNSC